MIKAIREYLLVRKMIKVKQDALDETIWDIKFFQVCKKKYVYMTIQEEKDLRADLAAELKKEKDKDNDKIRRMMNDIEQYKKVQTLYEQSKQTKVELEAYLKLLRG